MEIAYNKAASVSDTLLHFTGNENQAFRLNGHKKDITRNHFANCMLLLATGAPQEYIMFI